MIQTLNDSYKVLSHQNGNNVNELNGLKEEKKEIISQSDHLNKEILQLKELLKKESEETRKLEGEVEDMMGGKLNKEEE